MTLLEKKQESILTFSYSTRCYRSQPRNGKSLFRLMRSHPRTSSTRYRGQLLESKVALEL